MNRFTNEQTIVKLKNYTMNFALIYENQNPPKKISSNITTYNFNELDTKKAYKIIFDAADINKSSISNDILLKALYKSKLRMMINGGGSLKKLLNIELMAKWSEIQQLKSGQPSDIRQNYKNINLKSPTFSANVRFRSNELNRWRTLTDLNENYPVPTYSNQLHHLNTVDYFVSLNKWTNFTKGLKILKYRKSNLFDDRFWVDFQEFIVSEKINVFRKYTTQTNINKDQRLLFLDDIFHSGFYETLVNLIAEFRQLKNDTEIEEFYKNLRKSFFLNIYEILTLPRAYNNVKVSCETFYGKTITIDGNVSISSILEQSLMREKTSSSNSSKSKIKPTFGEYIDPRDLFNIDEEISDELLRIKTHPLLNIFSLDSTDANFNEDIKSFILQLQQNYLTFILQRNHALMIFWHKLPTNLNYQSNVANNRFKWILNSNGSPSIIYKIPSKTDTGKKNLSTKQHRDINIHAILNRYKRRLFCNPAENKSKMPASNYEKILDDD